MANTRLTPKIGCKAIFLSIVSINPLHANADLMYSSVFPLTEQQFHSYNGSFGGSVYCDTVGSYNAETFIWTQTGTCTDTGYSAWIHGGTHLESVHIPFIQANLVGQVDNLGQVRGGVFSLIGLIPDLGIDEVSLLATGRLIDAFYGPFVFETSVSTTMTRALIELTDVEAPFQDLGTVLLWNSFRTIGAWSPVGCETRDYECAWRISVTQSDYSEGGSGSHYLFYDRAMIVSISGSLWLFLAGLACAGRMYCGRRVRNPKASHCVL